ncbi:MAG: hypothetical protein Q9225_005466 [Loekoesia sp. 1 TL-2023]
MPLSFKSVCALLQALEDNAANTKKAMKGWLDQRNKDTIESWIKSYKVTVDSSEVDVVAVLSAIFPKERTDRVYSLQARSLSRILGRCFRLGIERIKQLDEWKNPGRGDLGASVERIVRQTEHQDVPNPVSLDEIDAALLQIAAKNRFSAPGVREAARDDGIETSRTLESVYLRLSSNEAKWFTRMILKDYSTLKFKSYHVLNAIDSRLAGALNIHSTYEAAIGLLRHQSAATESQAQPITLLKPIVGYKIGRVPYLKGRSVKNVVQLAEGRRMSIERKYDGEYCQIHVNLNKGSDCIQIFSKSGKDSTVDRQGVHEAIRQSLRIGQPECKFTWQCILEGEMVVYNDLENRVSEFHKIRKHVSRSGSWLGTELDSQAHKHEHLMISYYDIMMIDDHVVMAETHATRRRHLEELITCVRGRANLAKQKVIDFSSRHAPEKLRTLLAHAFAQRWEGLVLKPSNEEYFSARQTAKNLPAHCWIKLKKDYIPGLGDTVDFAVVGAGYNAARAAQLKCSDLKWTHFHIGCLKNKDQVNTKGAKAAFIVVAALEANLEMAKHLNQHGQFCASPFGSLTSFHDPFNIIVARGVSTMDVVFRKPFVFDVVGAGFEKEPNRDFFTLRFPRVLKIHGDRDWKESVGFDELQGLAKSARTVPEDTKPCVAEWIKQLEQVDRGAKGSTVPWDLSDDDMETPQEVGLSNHVTQSTACRSTRRPFVAPPMIRMDTQEMTGRETRLDSGEVVQKPPSQRSHITTWSESNLPTPPKSSPPQEVYTARDRQPLSSMQSTNPTDRQRKRSIDNEEAHHEERTPKRARVSPPVAKTKRPAGIRASIHQLANSKLPRSNKGPTSDASHTSSTSPQRQSSQGPPSKPFLVPKLSAGAAEALHFRAKPRIIRTMEPTSPERQTTADERSTEQGQSTQQSLISEWRLQNAEPTSPQNVHVPNLHDSYIVLSSDVSGMPYLTEDLLSNEGLASRHAHQVFGERPQLGQTRPPKSYYHDDKLQEMVVLIEGRRHDSSLEMLKFLIGRVPSDSSQVFWVFDWRLVEDMFARGVDDHDRLISKRLIARFWYDDDGEMKWLSASGGVKLIPWDNIEESKTISAAFLAE